MESWKLAAITATPSTKSENRNSRPSKLVLERIDYSELQALLLGAAKNSRQDLRLLINSAEIFRASAVYKDGRNEIGPLSAKICAGSLIGGPIGSFFGKLNVP